jgi:hypothetical protein
VTAKAAGCDEVTGRSWMQKPAAEVRDVLTGPTSADSLKEGRVGSPWSASR